MAAITGASVAQENRSESDVRYDTIGKNSEVFTVGDLVGLSSGVLLVQTTSVIGVIVKTVTMASTNQTVAKVTPGYTPIDNNTILLMGTDSDLTGNATDGGTYYMVTGATNAQKVKVSAGVTATTLRTVEIVKVDPFNEGGTGAGSGVRKCLVRVVKTPYTNVTITA